MPNRSQAGWRGVDVRRILANLMTMEMAAKQLACSPLPYGHAELVEWRWPSPLELTAREDRHMIEMSLPPYATDGVAALADVAPDRYCFMGSLFVRPAGLAITARSMGGHIRVVRLSLDPDICLVPALDGMSPDNLRSLLDFRDPAPRMLLRRIRDELASPGRDSIALVRAYADALLIEIRRSVEARFKQPRELARLADWQYRRVVERIEADALPPDVVSLAALCGVSARHFSRLFRGLTGESAGQAIDRARIRRAMRLLAEAQPMPLKRIAAELGFGQPSSFSHAFRRATGLSPNAWRQQNRSATDEAGAPTSH